MSVKKKSWVSELFRHLGLARRPDTGHGAGSVRVVRRIDDGATQIIGELRREGREYVFEYDMAYIEDPASTAIPAFPKLQDEYRSPELWSFFEVRIPSLERPEVEEALHRAGVDRNDKIAVLQHLGRRSIANSYELEAPGTGARS